MDIYNSFLQSDARVPEVQGIVRSRCPSPEFSTVPQAEFAKIRNLCNEWLNHKLRIRSLWL